MAGVAPTRRDHDPDRAARGLGQRGDRVAARHVRRRPGATSDPPGDSFHCVGLAHSMAEVQDRVRAQLVWDLRSLGAADLVTNEGQKADETSPVATFYPSCTSVSARRTASWANPIVRCITAKPAGPPTARRPTAATAPWSVTRSSAWPIGYPDPGFWCMNWSL